MAECVIHLGGVGGSCGTAAVQLGVDVPVDLACVGAAANTGANIDRCKSCVPDVSY